MRKIFTDTELRDFTATLRAAIQQRRLTITAAAQVLGITRQCLHLYLSGSGHQPRRRVLERACRAWNINFVAQGKRFDKDAFGQQHPLGHSKPAAVQLLLLPEAIERLNNTNLDVKILRKEPSRIRLELTVKFYG